MRFWAMVAVGLLATPGAWAFSAAAGKVCDVRQFGAIGKGVDKDTVAIQKAIDTCAANRGGGVVQLTNGTYLSGPITLKSNITLSIAPNASLLGSPDRADYPKFTFARKETVQPLVSAVNAENVTISGGGTIDGNGKIWWDYVKGVKDSGVLGTDHPRPMGILFDHCKHVKMDNVTVQNSGFWQIVPYYSDDLTFQNLRITAPLSPNTDAIDPFSSSHIVIDHVFSSTGDDNIAIKSGAINSPGPDAPSEYITITDCTFENGHGLSIGSEIAGGVQHVHAERIHFKGTDNGIRIKAARDRGHDVSDITFKDIEMDGVKNAIFITEYYPSNKAPEGDVAPAPVTRLTPKFHDIHLENVHAVNSVSDGIIVGLPESPVFDVTLKNVDVEGHGGMEIAYAKLTFDDVTFKAEQGDGLTVRKTAEIKTK
jgi:polygalacturonase